VANHETVADTLVDIGIYDNIESILEHLNQCKKHFFDSASSQALASLLLIASYTSSHYKCQNEMIPINWVHLIFVKSIFFVIERPRLLIEARASSYNSHS